MSRMQALAERIFDAEPAAVWAVVTDFSGARPKMLPDNYQNYHVERGADGTGVVLSYMLRAGGREREYHMQPEVVTPGQELLERDLASTYTTRWQLERIGPGAHTRVRLSSAWESRATGINGCFERLFAPLGMRRIHQETLVRLGQLMQERQVTTAGR